MSEVTIIKKLISIQQELKAPRNVDGRFGKARSAEQILEAVKPLCNKQDLYLMTSDEVSEVGGRNYITATAMLLDDSGGKLSAKASAWENDVSAGLDTSQVSGKTSSYAKKYALQNLFAIDDTKDADQEHDDMPFGDDGKGKGSKYDTTTPPSKSSVTTSKDGKKQLLATAKQIETLYSLAKAEGFTEQTLAVEWLSEKAGKDITDQTLTIKEASALIGELMK
jgi:hypothetical protein